MSGWRNEHQNAGFPGAFPSFIQIRFPALHTPIRGGVISGLIQGAGVRPPQGGATAGGAGRGVALVGRQRDWLSLRYCSAHYPGGKQGLIRPVPFCSSGNQHVPLTLRDP